MAVGFRYFGGVAVVLLVLVGCAGSNPSGAMDEFAALADASGQIEADISVSAVSSQLQAQVVQGNFIGTNIQATSPQGRKLVGSVWDDTDIVHVLVGQAQVSGRVVRAGDRAAFVGQINPSAPQAQASSNYFMPLILVAEGSTLAGSPVGTAVSFTGEVAVSYAAGLRNQKVSLSFQPTLASAPFRGGAGLVTLQQPAPSNAPTRWRGEGKLSNLEGRVVQTAVGRVLQVQGTFVGLTNWPLTPSNSIIAVLIAL